MSKKSFSHDEDVILIENVRNYRVLFDHENKDFRNLNSKYLAWKKISEIVGKDTDLCKKRWKDIRDNYYRTIRKGQLSTGSTAPLSTKKWPLFNRLSFLSDVNRERYSFCNISQQESQAGPSVSEEVDGENSNSPSEVSSNADNSMTPSSHWDPDSDPNISNSTSVPRSKSSKKRSQWDLMQERAEKRFALLERLADNKKADEDEVDLFMKSMAMKIKKLPSPLISKVQIGILSLVSKVADYSSTSRVYLNETGNVFNSSITHTNVSTPTNCNEPTQLLQEYSQLPTDESNVDKIINSVLSAYK